MCQNVLNNSCIYSSTICLKFKREIATMLIHGASWKNRRGLNLFYPVLLYNIEAADTVY